MPSSVVKKPRKSRQLTLFPTNDVSDQVGQLVTICKRLLEIAQKHLPRNADNYADFSTVIQCAKQLQFYGVAIEKNKADFEAEIVEAQQHNSVLLSMEYRYLKNKSIAGFATIADLGAKSPSTGTADYQTGLREAYKKASILAISFLDDVQRGPHDVKF